MWTASQGHPWQTAPQGGQEQATSPPPKRSNSEDFGDTNWPILPNSLSQSYHLIVVEGFACLNDLGSYVARGFVDCFIKSPMANSSLGGDQTKGSSNNWTLARIGPNWLKNQETLLKIGSTLSVAQTIGRWQELAQIGSKIKRHY